MAHPADPHPAAMEAHPAVVTAARPVEHLPEGEVTVARPVEHLPEGEVMAALLREDMGVLPPADTVVPPAWAGPSEDMEAHPATARQQDRRFTRWRLSLWFWGFCRCRRVAAGSGFSCR